jgi:acyl-CoA reductase-like NAD-dependent aldehyde dehydrogenase
MQEEVFGPILPVLEIGSAEAAIEWVNNRPRLLGLYVFAEDLGVAERILDSTESGDAVINDCAIHLLIPELPFGGVGNFGDGQVPREVGLRILHQRARRALSQRQDRSRSALPSVREAHFRAQVQGTIAP